MRQRIGAVLACIAAFAAGACGEAEGVEVQPLPPLERPSPEARAALPEVRGVWRFAGFEIPAGDTTAVRERVYALTPPGELRIVTQRLDSIAGQYVRAGVAFPFTGEVRRDSAIAVVAFSGGVGQFASGRVQRDTFWIELTSFTTAQTWPRGARAALVRGAAPAQPFRRLLGGAPIYVPVDSTAVRDSIRLDSLRRAGVIVPAPGTVPPGTVQPGVGQPVPGQPLPAGVQPGVVRPTAPGVQPGGVQPQRPAVQPQRPAPTQPQQRPPAQAQPRPQPQRPAPRPQPQRPPPAQEPVSEPAVEPDPPPSAPPPNPNAPRDTLRFGSPP